MASPTYTTPVAFTDAGYGTSLTVPSTEVGDLLVACLEGVAGRSLRVSGTGTITTPNLRRSAFGSNGAGGYIWTAEVTAAGSVTIGPDFGAGGGGFALYRINTGSWTSVGTANSATGTSTACAVSIGSASNDALVIGFGPNEYGGQTLTNGLTQDANSTGWYPARFGSKAVTSGAQTWDSTLSSSVAWVALAIIIEGSSGAGAQELTPSLVTNTQTFYAPTVGRGVATLAPSLVTNTQTFYASAVSASYGLAPSLVTNSQVFYGPVVAAGAVTLAPSLVTNSQIFYGPSVSTGAGPQELLPSLVTNEQTFYLATVASSYTLAPALVEKTKTFYSPTVNSEYSIVPGLVTHDKVFYGSTVSLQSDTTLYPDLFTHTKTIYGPTVVVGGLNTAKLYVDLFTGNLLYLKGLN